MFLSYRLAGTVSLRLSITNNS